MKLPVKNYNFTISHFLEYDRSTEKLFKVIIIGDPGVGKTSFIRRYVQNAFRADYKATVGVDFALKIVRWSPEQTIKLQLWDIAGKRSLRMTTVMNLHRQIIRLITFYFGGRSGKVHVDDTCLLQGSTRLHHHVRFDQPKFF